MVHRAKDAGRLRPDFVLDDVILALMVNSGLHADSPVARIAASQRFAALAIQAFRACGLPTAAIATIGADGIDNQEGR